MSESTPRSVYVQVRRWFFPMLIKDSNEQYVLFLGGHRGYLIDCEAQLKELQTAFGDTDTGHLGGELYRLVARISLVCMGITWYAVDFSNSYLGWVIAQALTPYVLGGIWARRFLSRQTDHPKRVHCNTEKGPFFQRISRRWAWCQMTVVTLLALAGIMRLPALIDRSALDACILMSLIYGFTWLLGAGPLRVLRNKTSIPWNKSADYKDPMEQER